jgi:hypothetical protein
MKNRIGANLKIEPRILRKPEESATIVLMNSFCTEPRVLRKPEEFDTVEPHSCNVS